MGFSCVFGYFTCDLGLYFVICFCFDLWFGVFVFLFVGFVVVFYLGLSALLGFTILFYCILGLGLLCV